MLFDYSKLKGKIVEVFGKQGAFAKAMDMSERTCSLKMTGRVYFTQKEIVQALRILNLGKDDIAEYFFAEKV